MFGFMNISEVQYILGFTTFLQQEIEKHTTPAHTQFPNVAYACGHFLICKSITKLGTGTGRRCKEIKPVG